MKTDPEIIEILRNASQEENGRQVIACSEAFRLCGQHGIETTRLAKLCDSAKIQIVRCQLGCF